MVRVAVGHIYHFGIYVSDNEVIQFGLPPNMRLGVPDSEVCVLASDVAGFLAGGFIEVCEFDPVEKKKNRTPDEVVSYARSKIGMRGYNILYNNCEHFANDCISGTKICRQAEDLRTLFRNMPIVDVYVTALPDSEPAGEFLCAERNKEIASVGSEKVRREKYFVWKLMLYALERSLGLHEKNTEFTKEEYGGWSVKGAHVSLSHSGGAIAVAVSRAPVGVDIEKIAPPKSESMAERIMNEAELSEYSSLPDGEKEERLISIWTAKEAIFKSKHIKSFIPNATDTKAEKHKTDIITVSGEKYAWSVATATPEKIRLFKNVDLK